MKRSQINPLAAEEEEFVAASTEELANLSELVRYILELESTDKKLKIHSHDDFIRAIYLAANSGVDAIKYQIYSGIFLRNVWKQQKKFTR